MTEFMNKSFSVGMAGDQKYRDNWDAIFKKPQRQTLSDKELYDIYGEKRAPTCSDCGKVLEVPGKDAGCHFLCSDCETPDSWDPDEDEEITPSGRLL